MNNIMKSLDNNLNKDQLEQHQIIQLSIEPCNQFERKF